jgi:hypothetical protein
MTNKGSRIELCLIPLKDISFPNGSGPHHKDAFLAPLNCKREDSLDCFALYLKRSAKAASRGGFVTSFHGNGT